MISAAWTYYEIVSILLRYSSVYCMMLSGYIWRAKQFCQPRLPNLSKSSAEVVCSITKHICIELCAKLLSKMSPSWTVRFPSQILYVFALSRSKDWTSALTQSSRRTVYCNVPLTLCKSYSSLASMLFKCLMNAVHLHYAPIKISKAGRPCAQVSEHTKRFSSAHFFQIASACTQTVCTVLLQVTNFNTGCAQGLITVS